MLFRSELARDIRVADSGRRLEKGPDQDPDDTNTQNSGTGASAGPVGPLMTPTGNETGGKG